MPLRRIYLCLRKRKLSINPFLLGLQQEGVFGAWYLRDVKVGCHGRRAVAGQDAVAEKNRESREEPRNHGERRKVQAEQARGKLQTRSGPNGEAV